MASEQMPRKENKSMEREVHVEEQSVPKVTAKIDVVTGRNNKDTPKEELKDTPKEEMKSGEQRKQNAEKARDSQELGTEGVGAVGTEGVGAVITCRLEGDEQRGGGEEEGDKQEKEENERSSLEEISKYRAEAQQKSMDAISAAQERYNRAKQAASEKLGNTTQTAQEKSDNVKNFAMEKAAQARDFAAEKGQQAYAAAKDMASKATNVSAEKGQKGYLAAKDTISSAAKGAVDYTAPVAEKAKDYTAQAAGKAKDATVESGKSAANVAADLKDKATVAGWGAAQVSADKTVEGTKAAANAVQGAAGYAGQKASELAAKSVETVKGLAAAAGETAKEYTARKKDEAEMELEVNKAAQPQETKEGTYEKTTTESLQRGEGQKQEHERGGTQRPSGPGHTGDHIPNNDSKPHESRKTVGSFQGVQKAGRERNQGEVGETTSPNEQKTKPTGESMNQSGLDVKGENVSTTIGHNVDSATQREQKPKENTDGRNSQGERVQGHQGRKGGESMTTIGKNVDNAPQREHYSSENLAGFEGGQEQLHGRQREDDGQRKFSGQRQGQQGRKSTEAMAPMTIGGAEGNVESAAGEIDKDYTARKEEEAERKLEAKKEEAERKLEAKNAAQPQETKDRTSEKTTTETLGSGEGQRHEKEGGRTWRPSAAGHILDHVPHKDSKPHGSNTAGRFQGVQETGRESNTIIPHAQKSKPTAEKLHQSGQDARGGNVSTIAIGHNVDSTAHREQRPNQNIGGRNFQGKRGEAMATTDGNVGNDSQGEHYSSRNISGFQGGQEQLHGRKGEEDGLGGFSGQGQGQQGRRGTEAMTSTAVGGKEEGSGAATRIGETLGDVAHMVKKPLDNVTEGGSEMLGAVGETVVEIGETMIKPGQKVQQQGQEGKGVGGVLNAIGETITEIAETTKVYVVGDGEADSMESVGSDSSFRRA